MSSDPGLLGIDDENMWDVEFDDLELEEEIASGAFGVVYKGSYCGTPVAVKQLFDPDNDIIQKLMQREVAILKSLRHPNVVNFMGLCNHETGIYIVTEFVEGGHLWGLLKQRDLALTWDERVQFLVDVSQAMNYLHRRKMLHRDLKTKNLLVDERRRVKVCDFGFARTFDTDPGDANKFMTKTGTALWMAPEIYMGKPYSNKADVFSFGVIAFEVIARRKPPERTPRTRFGFEEASLMEGLPVDSPTTLVQLMKECVDVDDAKRPDFTQILPRLKAIQKELKAAAQQQKEQAAASAAQSNQLPPPSVAPPVVPRRSHSKLPSSPAPELPQRMATSIMKPPPSAVPPLLQPPVSPAAVVDLSPSTQAGLEEIDLTKLDEAPALDAQEQVEMMAKLSQLDLLLDNPELAAKNNAPPPMAPPKSPSPPPFIRDRSPTAISLPMPPGLHSSDPPPATQPPSLLPPSDSSLFGLFGSSDGAGQKQAGNAMGGGAAAGASSSTAHNANVEGEALKVRAHVTETPLCSMRNLIVVLSGLQAAERPIAQIPVHLEERLKNVRKDLHVALDGCFESLALPSNAFQCNIKRALKVPPRLNKTEWIVACMTEVYHLILLSYGMVRSHCTDESCPNMTASDTIHYAWADGVKVISPQQVTAPKYVHLLNEYVAEHLANQDNFPAEARFSRKNVTAALRVIAKRLFRVLNHIYFCHWSLCLSLSVSQHFKVVVAIVYHFVVDFKLVDKKADATTLEPLGPLLSELGIW